MSAPRVVVLDYGSGNVHSAVKALERAGADVVLTGDRAAALEADGLVVPGVGSFAHVMDALDAARVGELIDRRLIAGRAVLGICVGMQVLFERGVERGVEREGLGQWPGPVELLPADIVPHMGWSRVTPPADSRLFAGLEDAQFYFVHSYAAQSWWLDDSHFRAPLVTWAEHGGPFVAAVENGPLTATQFHPEKSGDAGIALLRNWLAGLGEH